MPAPLAALAIPLISTEAVSGALTVLGIAGTATAAGVAVGTAINKNSSSQEILTASDQFNAAQRDINMATSLSNTGGLTNEDKAMIVAKYPYLTLDAGGNPAVKSDPATASGGSLQVQVDTNNNNLTISNNVVGTQYPLESTDGPQNYAVNNLVTTVAQTSSDPNLEAFAATNTPAYNQSTVNQNDLLDTGVIGQNVSVASVDYLGTTPTDLGTASTQQGYVAPGFRSGALDQLPDNSISRPQQVLPAFTQVGVSGRPLIQTDENGLVIGSQVSPYSTAVAQNYAGSVAAAAGISPSPDLPMAVPPGTNSPQYSSDAAGSLASANASQNSAPSTASGGGGSVRPNILHDYANYTYRFSLWAAGFDAINAIGEGGISPGSPESILSGAECILADGGFGTYPAAREFSGTVLGIDNVVIESVVGKGAGARSTDMIGMKFNILEPYTVSLFNRLSKMAIRLNYTGGDFSMLFFVLKLEFLGYDDYGNPVTIPATKYFPISMQKVELSIDKTRGAVYSVEASPATNAALAAFSNNIPCHVEIKATTVEELFNSNGASYAGGSQSSGAAAQRADSAATSTPASSGPATITKGLKDAMNDNETYLVKSGKKELPNDYKFVFKSSEIGQAKLLDPKIVKAASVAMSENKNDPAAIMAGKQGKLAVASDKNVFRAQAGTKVTDFFNSVMTVTDYMTSQYKPTADKGSPVNLWKIFPAIKFGPVDKKTNYFKYSVTYYIDKYVMHGLDHPNFGQVEIPGIMKSYNYIFTGKNQDVLDVELKYNYAFFEMRQGATVGYTQKANDQIGSDVQPRTDGAATQDDRIIKPKYLVSNGIANRQNSGSTTQSDASLGVTELMEKLLDNGGDLSELKLTIVGDPDWVQQDYFLFGPNMPQQTSLPNGTITYHANPAYFYFQFSAPQDDYDPYSGLFQATSDQATFSGKFMVNKVNSEFNKGKFTQTLENVRVRNQKNAQSSSQTRTDSAPGAGFRSGATDQVKAEPATTAASSQAGFVPAAPEPTGGPNIVAALQFGMGA